MPSKLLEVFKKYNDAGFNLPTLLAVLPLVVTALITLRIAYGDITQAVYVIGEIGLIQMWTQGIGSLLVNVVPFVLIILVLYFIKQGKRHPAMYFSALLLSGLVYFITNIMTVIVAIIFVFILIPLHDKRINSRLAKNDGEFKKSHENISAKLKNAKDSERLEYIKRDIASLKSDNSLRIQKLKDSLRSLLFTIGCLVLVQVVLSYPTIPRTTLALKDNKNISGLVMKRDDDRVMIYDQDNKAIKMAYIANIKTEDVCAPKTLGALYGFGWSLSRLMLEYQGKASVPYATCDEE